MPHERRSHAPKALRLFSESQRRAYAEGFAVGFARAFPATKAEALAEAVLHVLAQRSIAITDAQRRQIAECIDLELLDRWIGRAFSVTSVDELLG